MWPQTARQHCSTDPQQNVDDDYCACRVKAVGGIHMIGAPTFFLNNGPAKSKSGPANTVRTSSMRQVIL